jgi:hypothetical protein
MFRLRLPQLIHDDEAINLSPKSDDDQQMGMKEDAKNIEDSGKRKMNANKIVKQQIMADINWSPYLEKFAKVPKEKLTSEISKTLLQTGVGPSQPLLEGQADKSSRENFIKSVTIALMATPEYQLC